MKDKGHLIWRTKRRQMRSVLLQALSALLYLGLASGEAEKEAVLTLDGQEQFDSAVKKSSFLVAEFYAPCKVFVLTLLTHTPLGSTEPSPSCARVRALQVPGPRV